MSINLKEKITVILDVYVKEELANRVSQFSVIGLRGAIMQAIDDYENEKVKDKDGGQNE